MNDPASPPSRLLKITAVTARWLLGLLIGAWLLFALSVVVLHGWIVPRIGDYRGALEAQASKAIGVPVRIGSISASSGNLFPTFELRDVVLLDPQQREALRLARVVASVSPRSVWRLSFEQLYIEKPQLDVRLDMAGRFHVAGLDMSGESSGESRIADWFFAQREFVIQGGAVRWTDERRHSDPLLLTDVRFVARNGGRRHTMRLDATPPAGWGERFSVRGMFRQPLLSVRTGHWQTWDGQLYADLPYIDVRRLGRYVTLDARIREGSGALRAWADVRDGQLRGGAADLALAHIDVALDADLEPLVLRAVTGRLSSQLKDRTFEFSTTALQFDTADGLRWPGGNLWFQHTPAQGRTPERGALRADRLDLAALALIAGRLPLGDATHKALDAYAPRGVVERVDLSWRGPAGAPDSYQAKGRISGLRIASQPAVAPAAARTGASPPAGTPGLRGATVDFDATQAGGTATLSIAQGALEFPGVFDEPIIPIDQLSTGLQWTLDKRKGSAQLQLSNLRFANADAEGHAQANWRTSDPAVSHGRDRYPGVLDLQGQLTRADGTRVFRYLPLEIPKATRDYVRSAVSKGTASTVDFRVRGDLHDMPFTDPRDGEFRIAAKVADVRYAYAPPEFAADGKAAGPVWPPLTGVSGDLIFERAGMQVRNARGRIVGAPNIEVSRADVEIADMSHRSPLLKVDAQAKGPLGELLSAGAPLAGDAASLLAAARASGNADYRLRLDLPIEAVDKTRVQATVVLNDNELQLTPEAPALTRARGTVNITENGFSLAGTQARVAGGEVRVEGQGRFADAGETLNLKAQGTLTADGLRAIDEIGWLPRVAARMEGSASYNAAITMRDGVPEFSVTSSLQGLALALPAPLAKTADEPMPLHIEKKLVLNEHRMGNGTPTRHDQLSLTLGQGTSMVYVRDISRPDDVRVLRGAIGLGTDATASAVPPERGVMANLSFARFDIPLWESLFSEATGSAPQSTTEAQDAGDPLAYVPTLVAIRAKELVFGGRTLHNVVLGGTREGPQWRTNVDADELNGYAEYRQTQDGRVFARLSRLRIDRSEATEVESLLDEQPGTLPALDVVIDDFELFGKRLGRAEIDAVNRGGNGREWRLNKLALTMPEAAFSAQGSWAATGTGSSARAEQRRTALDFKLDIADAGALLTRFGMGGVLRGGRGTLQGDVDWRGSPFALDYPSMNGQLNVDVGAGQFLKADPGLAKLLGVLSLQALPRRLTLDFRDVFSEGFAFDFIRGDAKIRQGTATTNNLQMKGVNAAALMEGSADIAHETQSLRVVVVPDINAGTAALVATAINPVIGLGTFLAQALLSKPLSAATTQEFMIEGTWADPKIARVPRNTLPPGGQNNPKEIPP